jgi:cysteine desulfurase
MARRPIYLDHHATTPTDPRVVEAMLPYFTERFGNASSIQHAYGWEAADAVDRAREEVAALISASSQEVVFTSGATESNNLAIKGVAAAMRAKGDHFVSSAIEHRAVIDPLRRLSREENWNLTLLKPDSVGRTSEEAVRDSLTESSVLVSIAMANNEIGAINPISRIGEVCRGRGVLFHTDASQAAGKIPINVRTQAIDLLSLTAHKMYGPKGIGALYVRQGVRIRSILDGGGHERGLRSGTLPVPLIVGFGAASEIARAELHEENARLRALRDRLHDAIVSLLGESATRLNGPKNDRLPNNLHLSFHGVDGKALLQNLRGLAVSSGAACSSAESGPSHVLRALDVPETLVDASLRFGLGRFTTAEEVDEAARIVASTVKSLRVPTCDPSQGA